MNYSDYELRGACIEGLTLAHTPPNQVRHFFRNSCLVTA